MEEVMAKADIVVATTGVKNLIPPEMVRPGQVIFALSNPESEILPAVALEHGAALAADGRSVNNLLGFPGIWRGALDCRASRITQDMLIDAGKALADISSPNDILPFVLDKGVHRVVAQAVAKAAMRTEVARKPLDEDYFERP
jgi:malate dehydrogenase (oxaloacetate-decarboxylating)